MTLKEYATALKKLTLTTSILVGSTIELFARAGGGGSAGFYGLFHNPLLLILSLGFVGILVLAVRLRIVRTRRRLARFAKLDPVWKFKELEKTIEKTYFKVQAAWNKGDLEPVKDLLTEKMMNKLRLQLDYYKSINKKNVLEEIELNSAEIISASDYEDDSKDTFKALISGSMIDYDLNLKTGKTTGNNSSAESFSEYWIFTRIADNWLLDEIKD